MLLVSNTTQYRTNIVELTAKPAWPQATYIPWPPWYSPCTRPRDHPETRTVSRSWRRDALYNVPRRDKWCPVLYVNQIQGAGETVWCVLSPEAATRRGQITQQAALLEELIIVLVCVTKMTTTMMITESRKWSIYSRWWKFNLISVSNPRTS